MASWNIWDWLVGGGTSQQKLVMKMGKLKKAEQRLIEYAYRHVAAYQQQNDSNDEEIPIKIRTLDTIISKTSVPLRCYDTDYLHQHSSSSSNTSHTDPTLWKSLLASEYDPKQHYIIHSIHVTSSSNNSSDKNKMKKTDVPLILLHGYMNSGAYFYRNFIGLSQYFTSIHALDMLGWGLSSRPDFATCNLATKNSNESDDPNNTVDSSTSSWLYSLWSSKKNVSNNDSNQMMKKSYITKAAEDFFVESLEEWRKRNRIDKMILAGHSMGGYLSVAYVERYPEHVDQLILLSPVGVPELTKEEVEKRKQRMKQASFPFRMLIFFYRSLFGYFTLGDILRILPETTAQSYAQNYVRRRLPLITSIDEQEAVSDLLLYNNILPGSGEYCVDKVLDDTIHARVPLVYRIPQLNIPKVGFLYGENDWMDYRAALQVQQICEQQQQERNGTLSSSPEIIVYQISQSGHLLMLENWQEFNNAVLLCCNPNEFHHILNRTLTRTTKPSLPTKLIPRTPNVLLLSQSPQTMKQQSLSSTQPRIHPTQSK